MAAASIMKKRDPSIPPFSVQRALAVGQMMRKELLNKELPHIATAWADWEHIKFGLESSSELIYPEPYTTVMRQPSPDKPRASWGGAPEANVIGRVHKLRIIIYDLNFRPIAEVGDLSEKIKVVHIRFTGLHYDHLLLTGE
jgi:hypothetical protein